MTITKYIKGYIFDSEQDAINAREKCDVYFGIPVSSEDVTQNWCEYFFAELQGFYYIIFDESLRHIFGEPLDLEIHYTPIVL